MRFEINKKTTQKETVSKCLKINFESNLRISKSPEMLSFDRASFSGRHHHHTFNQIKYAYIFLFSCSFRLFSLKRLILVCFNFNETYSN